MARLVLDAQTYTFQDGTRLKDIPTEELLETYTQADSIFIGLASEYASEEEIKNLREKYDNLTRHSDLWNDGDESEKNNTDIRTDIMEFDHLRRFTYENHLNEETDKPEKETENFKDFDEWEENLIENMADKEIERMEANADMSEIAMEEEISQNEYEEQEEEEAAEENNATTEAMTFRKKPVEIRAMKWNGENLDSIESFAKGNASMENGELIIKTLEDGKEGQAIHAASVGDYIIEGVQGEFYFCKPDIFEQTYDAVPENGELSFRKKPVEIRAMKWDGENLDSIESFAKGNASMENGELVIKTLEDGKEGQAIHAASVGDYIIEGVQGEFYFCKPDIFEQTYDAVPENTKNIKKEFMEGLKKENDEKKEETQKEEFVNPEEIPFLSETEEKSESKEKEAVNTEEETKGNESAAPEEKEEAEEKKEEKKAGFFRRLFGKKEKPAGENPSETPEEKNNGEEKSEPEKESGNGKMEEGQFYQVTFSFKNAEGEDEEIKAVYAIAPNSKGKPSLRCANNKEKINEAFPYTDTTLPAGDENIENNRRARGLNGFPPGILNNDDLLEAWNKRLNDPNMKIKLPPFPEGTSEMKVSVENITKKLEKTRGENIPAEEKKEETKAVAKEEEDKNEKKPTVPVPEKLRRDGITNERPVSEEDYTELLYLRSKEIFMLADEDRNMAEEDKKYFKKLWKAYSETDGSEKEMRKAFDSYIRNPDNENDIMGMGICMEKHILSNQGFKRNIPAEIKYNADTQLMAVKNNKHPLQIAGIPPLIFNPEENSIYRGCAQMLLQTNNNINGMNEKAYVTASQAQQAGGMMLPNYKASTLLVPHGQDSRGRYVYQMLVPCSALAKRNAEKEMRKLEKDQVKLAYKNALNELKFFKKHHMLPLYRINMTSDPLPPQANISDINIGYPPPADAPIEKLIEHDTKALLAAALTQTQYTPTVDYTKSPYKEAFEQFIKKNPQKTIENQNQSYLEIGQQIQEARDKANGIENKQEETRTQGNAIVPENKKENVNQKSNGHGRRTGGRH